MVFFNVEERRPVYGRQALGEYLEGYEGRLMRSLKSLLGSKLLKSETTVLGSALPFKDLLGLFIGQLKARGEAAAGQAFDAVVLGRPVFFVDDDPEADREAQDTLVQVANKLGFKEVSFQYEPIAAAFDYERCIQREELVLIVDIGGGTSDFSLVRLAPERRNLAERQDDILATGGVHIGGTDFDKQLSLEGVMPLFGYGSRMKSDAFMPTSYHLNLATWHTINAVYAQKSQLALKNMRYDIVDSTGIDRLFRLIEERAGHWLAMQVEDSKIRLTETERLHLSLERIEAGLGVEADPWAVRERRRRTAGARAQQRRATAGLGRGRPGPGRHGVLHRRFERHSGAAPERLGDAAQRPSCRGQPVRQHRQRPGHRGEEALRLSRPGRAPAL